MDRSIENLYLVNSSVHFILNKVVKNSCVNKNKLNVINVWMWDVSLRRYSCSPDEQNVHVKQTLTQNESKLESWQGLFWNNVFHQQNKVFTCVSWKPTVILFKWTLLRLTLMTTNSVKHFVAPVYVKQPT